MPGLFDDMVSPEEQRGIRYQNLFGNLVSAGLNAVAAGGSMMERERAPYIAAAGQALGGMGQQNAEQIGALARQKLMGSQYAENKQKVEEKKRIDGYMQSPEFLDAFATAPPEIKAMVKVNPQAAMSALSNWRQMVATAAAEKQKALQAGWQVKQDQYGNMIRINAITGEMQPINVGGNPFDQYGVPRPDGGQPALTPQQQTVAAQPPAYAAPYTGLRNEPALGYAGPSQPAAQPTAPPKNYASVPEGEYARVFGLPGAANNLFAGAQAMSGNSLSENSIYDEAMRSNYKVARNDALKAVSVDMPGRSTKASLEKIQALMPNMDNPVVGRDSAYTGLIAVRDELDSEIKKLNVQMAAPSNAKDRQKIAANLADLYKARDNMARIAEGTRTSFGRGGKDPKAIAQGQPQAENPDIAEARRRGLIK